MGQWRTAVGNCCSGERQRLTGFADSNDETGGEEL